MAHARVVLCPLRLTKRPNGHVAGNRRLRAILGALCSMLLLRALGFFLESKPVRRGCFVVSRYAALMSAPAGCAALLADAPILQLERSSLRVAKKAGLGLICASGVSSD